LLCHRKPEGVGGGGRGVTAVCLQAEQHSREPDSGGGLVTSTLAQNGVGSENKNVTSCP
jgi:hypothetical protein